MYVLFHLLGIVLIFNCIYVYLLFTSQPNGLYRLISSFLGANGFHRVIKKLTRRANAQWLTPIRVNILVIHRRSASLNKFDDLRSKTWLLSKCMQPLSYWKATSASCVNHCACKVTYWPQKWWRCRKFDRLVAADWPYSQSIEVTDATRPTAAIIAGNTSQGGPQNGSPESTFLAPLRAL